jgi:hypothetical protein
MAHTDLKVLGAGCAFWLLISAAASVWWIVGLLVLPFFALLVPAVITTVLEAPRLWRPMLGALPNLVSALTSGVLLGSGPESWGPLVVGAICAGTLIAFSIAMAMALFRPR